MTVMTADGDGVKHHGVCSDWILGYTGGAVVIHQENANQQTTGKGIDLEYFANESDLTTRVSALGLTPFAGPGE